MKIQVSGNVVAQKRMSGRDDSGEWSSDIFGGIYLTVIQFAKDDDEIVSEVLNLRCPADIFDSDSFEFDTFGAYDFIVNLREYKSSVQKEVVSFKRLKDSENNTKIVFDVGKQL